MEPRQAGRCPRWYTAHALLDAAQIVTVGDKHIKFWTVVGGGLTSKRGTFGAQGKLDTMLCVAFGKDGSAFSGGANGLVHQSVPSVDHATLTQHFQMGRQQSGGDVPMPRRARLLHVPFGCRCGGACE